MANLEQVLPVRQTWKLIEELISFSHRPVFLKGITHPGDAVRAIQIGAAGIIVSNHGARNLDTQPATIEALPRVTAAVGGRVPVLIDGVDNAVASAYGGWPDRLYLIGRDGRVAFQGDEGPFGFKVKPFAAAIAAELATRR